MKTKPKETATASSHQMVTEEITLHTGKKTIKIGFTDQRLSGHAGQATIWGFARMRGYGKLLRRVLPHHPSSPNATDPVDIGLGFTSGILAGAEKLTRIAWLRSDPVLPDVVGIKKIVSQSTFSRFFGVFWGAACNQRCFRPMWHWAMKQLPSRKGGYALDFDSTELMHEDGHQEGVATGYTRQGLKPCLHPLLAVIEEAKVVAQFWLRAGNSSSANNVVGFTQELLSNLPKHLSLRLARADSGFCQDPWLRLLEERALPYIVVARLNVKLQRLIRRETQWEATEVPGTEVAEVWHQEQGWEKPRRLILIRHRTEEKKRPGGKTLLEVPGYLFQGLVTSLPESVRGIDVWREYNGRAGLEGVIKDLDYGFALPKLCLAKFWATEAALSMAVMTYNLYILFQRHLGWLERVQIETMRFRLFTTAGVLSHAQGSTTIKLAVPPKHRPWWRSIWQKILSEIPNCNAVGQQPAPA